MVVFDLDDTLYKEVDYVRSGIRAIAKAAATEGYISENEAYEIVTSAPDTATGFDLLEARSLICNPESTLNVGRIVEIYRTHKPEIILSEETAGVLCELQKRNIAMGIITDGRSRAQRAKINALGLGRFVKDSNISISEEIGADKHKPDAFKRIAAANPDETEFIYVGDNPEKDFIWPNHLGWISVMLRDANVENIHRQSPEDLPEANHPSIVIDSINDLLQILK